MVKAYFLEQATRCSKAAQFQGFAPGARVRYARMALRFELKAARCL